jgi:FkbM family methyltransferase
MTSYRKLPGFLYRRLARWITCEVQLMGEHPLALNNKFQVNSLQDVFCHPFYWQLYGWLPSPPSLVVDLGAHCGHFSLLADICFRTQFGACDVEYLLIEPNPKLSQVLGQNLRRSGLCRRHSIRQGLVGAKRAGSDELWVCSHNFLSASLQPAPDTYSVTADYLDLDALTANREIDLLKIDIEGAEYDLAATYADLLRRVSRVMIEIHERSGAHVQAIYSSFEKAGLRLRSPALKHGNALLGMFERR